MKINRRGRWPARFMTLVVTGLLSLPAFPMAQPPPDLVLLVVVDQLRGDVPWRMRDRLAGGGFRFLMDRGVSYANARLSHAHTVTAAGHAALVTGGNAPQHGIPANQWFDRGARKAVYCLEDARYPEIGLPAGWAEGRGPGNLSSSTVGDELVRFGRGRPRVFSVSIKDRSAIIMGGHLGKAFWYSERTGRMVSSAYYYEGLPGWAQRWNAARPADAQLAKTWNLLQERGAYVYFGSDDRPEERPKEGLGRVFPHRASRDGEAFNYAALPYTPMGDRLTLDFLEALFEAERPGRNGVTDLVAVSFSATDYIGHAFGPFSLEAEDNFLQLDRTLAELFRFVDQRVGLDRTLIVLSSDHGVAPIPESVAAQGMEAGRVDPQGMMLAANQELQARYGTTRRLALAFENPGIYLDPQGLADLGLEVAAVERALADRIMQVPGIRSAYTRSDLLAGRIAGTGEAASVLAAFHPRRSGDVILVPEPFWYFGGDRYGSAATHGSPHAYDAHVPLFVAGPGIRSKVVNRPVAARDVAPTISAWLGIAPPSGSVGAPLAEALDREKR